MKEIDFFKFLLDHTKNGDIVWELHSTLDPSLTKYYCNRVAYIRYNDIILRENDYFIKDMCYSYSDNLSDIINEIFEYVVNKDKVLDDGYKDLVYSIDYQNHIKNNHE